MLSNLFLKFDYGLPTASLDPLIIALAIENLQMIAKLSRSCSLVFSSSLELD